MITAVDYMDIFLEIARVWLLMIPDCDSTLPVISEEGLELMLSWEILEIPSIFVQLPTRGGLVAMPSAV